MSDLSGDYGRQMEEGCRVAIDKMSKAHLALLHVSKSLLEIREMINEAVRVFGATYGTTDSEQLYMLRGHPGADTLTLLANAQGALQSELDHGIPQILSLNDQAGRRALAYLATVRRISGLE